jgi:hypothetical protein
MSGSDPEMQELRDELPDDLISAGYVGAYQFPDNSRRRIPGIIYLVSALLCGAVWQLAREASPLVNDGMLWVALALGLAGLFAVSSGWSMKIDEREALVAAQQAVGFAVGHASAQQVWHGLRSRPTWRVLCYSAEEPPRQRGLVLVDALDGHIVEQLIEANPEQWMGR